MGSGLNTSTTDIQQNTISTNAMGKQMDVQPRNEMEMPVCACLLYTSRCV